MSFEYSIEVKDLGKLYQIYDKPSDRLKQILASGCKKYYKEFWALKNISFKIKKGETVGVIGRNGSGKSTLLQIICGTLTPNHGEIKVDGRVAALLELGAGFNPEFSGVENVYLAASLYGLSREEIDQRFDEIASFADIGDHIYQPVKHYSSGMYARLAFAVVIHVSPDVLIIDEALAVGDARFVAKCMKRIKELQDIGVTILFVSHDVGSVRALCERAIWLHNGEMLAFDDVFPVTGQFMEFIFRDEKDHGSDITGAAEINQDLYLPTRKELGIKKNDLSSNFQAELNGCNESFSGFVSKIDPHPLNHWGSHQGLIKSAAVLDCSGNKKDVFYFGDPISVVVDVCIPRNISREHLSVAISLKDLKGVDLIVSTTHDFGGTYLPCEEFFSVSFSMINPLVGGAYLLVAAIEDRKDNDVHYYEYIEGVHYFTSLANSRLFGVFQPPIEKSIILK